MCVPVLKCHQLQGGFAPLTPHRGLCLLDPRWGLRPQTPRYRLALPRSPYCGLSPPYYYFLPPPLSADADNGLDAFSGQSRSTNMVPFHMLHRVSYCTCNSNFVFKTRRFLRYSSSKNFMTLKWGSKLTQGH